MSSEEPARSVAEQLAAEQLAVEARTHRRTALVALSGELDLLTVSKVAEVLDGLEPQPDGVRHVVLDLRGLTFMDVLGLKELLRQNEFARSNRHNLAVVRGTDAIQRVLALTGVEDDARPRGRPRRPGAAARHALAGRGLRMIARSATSLARRCFAGRQRRSRRRSRPAPPEYLRLAGYIGRIEWFGGIITCSP